MKDAWIDLLTNSVFCKTVNITWRKLNKKFIKKIITQLILDNYLIDHVKLVGIRRNFSIRRYEIVLKEYEYYYDSIEQTNENVWVLVEHQHHIEFLFFHLDQLHRQIFDCFYIWENLCEKKKDENSSVSIVVDYFI